MSASDKYTYDPLDTRPGEMEVRLGGEPDSYNIMMTNAKSQRYALNLFGNGLIYHSQPFPENTEITGYVKLVVWIAMDVPDTDFMVTVHEIMPDGTSIQLADDALRARYRESPRREKLVRPGEITRYEFNQFWFFSRRIAKGSRLRLVFWSPNSIHLEKNYNSGGVIAEESGKDARTAHITLYHALTIRAIKRFRWQGRTRRNDMRKNWFLFLFMVSITLCLFSSQEKKEEPNVVALIGGTLIDGTGASHNCLSIPLFYNNI